MPKKFSGIFPENFGLRKKLKKIDSFRIFFYDPQMKFFLFAELPSLKRVIFLS